MKLWGFNISKMSLTSLIETLIFYKRTFNKHSARINFYSNCKTVPSFWQKAFHKESLNSKLQQSFDSHWFNLLRLGWHGPISADQGTHRDFIYATCPWGSMVKVWNRMNGDGGDSEIEAFVAAAGQRKTPEKSQTSSAAFQAGHKQRIGVYVGSRGVTRNWQGVTWKIKDLQSTQKGRYC